jgi:hypothetical protein
VNINVETKQDAGPLKKQPYREGSHIFKIGVLTLPSQNKSQITMILSNLCCIYAIDVYDE